MVQILTPFRNNGQLEDVKQIWLLFYFYEIAKLIFFIYSRQHELEFKTLKMKWRRLKYLDVFKIKNAHTIILVAACLHNFGLTHVADCDDGVYAEFDDEDDDNLAYEFEIDEEEQMGNEKRQFLPNQMRAQ